MQNLRESIGLIRSSLVLALVLFVIALGVIIAHAWLIRRRGGAGMVPHARLLASTSCCAFVMLTLHMFYLASVVVPRLLTLVQLAHASPPAALKVLGTAGAVLMIPTLYTLPALQAGFPYAFVALGVGLWITSLTEGALVEEAIPRLRRITALMVLGSLFIASISFWSLFNVWGLYTELSRGL